MDPLVAFCRHGAAELVGLEAALEALGALRDLLDAVPARVALFSADRRHRYVNRPYREFLELPAERILGRSVEDILGPELFRALKPFGDRALAGESVEAEGWFFYPGRGRRYTRRVYTPIRGSGRGFDGFVAFIEDMTVRRLAEDTLRASETLKSAAIDGALDSIIAIDADGTILEFNPAAERTFGQWRTEMIGRRFAEAVLPPDQRLAYHAELARFRTDGAHDLVGRRTEIEAVRADGRRFPVDLTLTDALIGGRRVFTAHLRDISERKRSERELAEVAYHDAVTGLANRQRLLRAISDAMAKSQPVTVVLVEIDRFANLRSTFGHGFADDLLIGLARGLSAGIEPGGLLARVDQHVFALLLLGTDDPAAVDATVEAITASVRDAVSSSGATVFLSASIGIATVTADHRRSEEILRDAEIAAGRARDSGGGCSVRFDREMYRSVIERVRSEHDLRRALASEGELWLAYQPIVEMVTGRLAGFEALARWHHVERGLIPPSGFVPIAEEAGLIVPLGRWVVARACAQLAAWQSQREPGAAPLFMSINLSPRQLEDAGCVEGVRREIFEAGIDPAWVKLEITEGALIRKPEESIATLQRLKDLGVGLSIDDFGTGYSSLSYLHRLPVDSVKIDRSFVTALNHSEENRAIVRVIVDLGRLFGYDVIAEGIETAEDCNLLRALACDYGQGYYFARPLPAEAALSLVRGDLPWQTALADDDEE
ncbi:MAG: EAL domain-containing protein [Azospirillum sp.]|nr:EAL domain-containing protein [Azospirillum sp.]